MDFYLSCKNKDVLYAKIFEKYLKKIPEFKNKNNMQILLIPLKNKSSFSCEFSYANHPYKIIINYNEENNIIQIDAIIIKELLKKNLNYFLLEEILLMNNTKKELEQISSDYINYQELINKQGYNAIFKTFDKLIK